MHCRTLSRIPGLCPLDASTTTRVGTIRNVPRHCQMSPGGRVVEQQGGEDGGMRPVVEHTRPKTVGSNPDAPTDNLVTRLQKWGVVPESPGQKTCPQPGQAIPRGMEPLL